MQEYQRRSSGQNIEISSPIFTGAEAVEAAVEAAIEVGAVEEEGAAGGESEATGLTGLEGEGLDAAVTVEDDLVSFVAANEGDMIKE